MSSTSVTVVAVATAKKSSMVIGLIVSLVAKAGLRGALYRTLLLGLCVMTVEMSGVCIQKPLTAFSGVCVRAFITKKRGAKFE